MKKGQRLRWYHTCGGYSRHKRCVMQRRILEHLQAWYVNALLTQTQMQFIEVAVSNPKRI